MNNHLGGHLNKTHIDEGTLDYLIKTLHVKGFIDIGCGPGGMVELAQDKGLHAIGIDGDDSLFGTWHDNHVPVILHDFQQPITRYEIPPVDLVWSVEFLEHVEEKYIDNFLPVFLKGKYIVCTAAPPGTPGHHHVNCQPQEYWIEKFEAAGMKFDELQTHKIRKVSTMAKPFMQKHGMFFHGVR